MLVALCVCAAIEPLALRTRVVVLSHRREVRKPTNTGRLVPLLLRSGAVQVWGLPGDRLEASALVGAERRGLLLYPAGDAVPLSRAEVDADGGRVTLVVPDGTWRQARKLHSRAAALAELPRVCLPPGPPSRYRLRKHSDPRFLATFEAVARALGILEGAEVQRHLERVFDLVVERTLWSRGLLGGPLRVPGETGAGSPPASD